VTKELDRIKRARSLIEDDSESPDSPAHSSHKGGARSNQVNYPQSNGEGIGYRPDPATAYGLDKLDSACSQVSSQNLEGYSLDGPQISQLFKEYSIYFSLCSFHPSRF
jgi:hypothetical protein